MDTEAATRKHMNPSTESQFFGLLRQLSGDGADDAQQTKILKSLTSMRNLQLSSKGSTLFRQECSDSLKGLMEKLMVQQNKLWSSIWIFIVEQLGQELHSDNKFLNSMLSVLEQGMKRKDPVSMRWSLTCWQVLIDNFALNPKMIAAPRRVQLLTIPLKAKNVKEAEVLELKFQLWWHLFTALGEFIDLHSENVTKPFMQFTFGPYEQGESHLLSKFPGAAKTALLFLTSFVATGVADEELAQLDTKFKSSKPLINDQKVFLCLAEAVVRSIDVLLKQPEELPSAPFKVLIKATLIRLGMLCKENPAVGGDVLALLLKTLKGTLFGLIVLKKKYKDLLLSTIDAFFKSQVDLDMKLKYINHTSPRDFLFGLLCDKEHLLLHAKPTIAKSDERQCELLGDLLTKPTTMVAQPDRLANAKLLVDTLSELLDMSQGEAARKCFHLWEQCSKFLCRMPKEAPNEQCNQISQQIFFALIMMPFRLILSSGAADCISTAMAENSVVKMLKNLFFHYSEIVYLSLSVAVPGGSGKEIPLLKIYQRICILMTLEKYPPSTCQSLIKVIVKFVSVRSNVNYTKLFGRAAGQEMAELRLLAKLTGMLVHLSADSPQIAGKLCSYVAKGLENLVLLVTTPEPTIEAINIFHELLTKTPSAFWPNNRMEVTDPWDSLVSPFGKLWSADQAEMAKRMSLLMAVKPKIQNLTEHGDIKVCNSAREMLARYSQPVQSGDSNDSLKTPTSGRSTSRKRSFLMTQQQSSPVTTLSQTSSPTQNLSPSQNKQSPARPSLEDLDSQDFVKIIPSQPKMKKPLTPHQREVKRRRRDDIPALYQGLSQDTQASQDTQDLESPPVIQVPPRLPPNVPTSVWSEDAVDVDLVSSTNMESDENKSLNSQNEPVVLEPEDKELKKPDSQDIDIVENSQAYSTVPMQQSEPKPEAETLLMARVRNRQGVLLPPTLRAANKEPEVAPAVQKESPAPVNKRKSLPPVRGAGLKGRAAQMVGLATTKDTVSPVDSEAKAEISAPVLMSNLIAKAEAKAVEMADANDKSPEKTSSAEASVTPISSHRKRSNLKKETPKATPSPRRLKRVSFAEPIVSGEQDSPTILQDIQVYNNYYKQSPNTKKKMKASRKLMMAPKDGYQIIKEHAKLNFECPSKDEETPQSSGLIEPSLTDCSVPVSQIADKLVSPLRAERLLNQLDEMNVKTVQDLNQLPETAIAELQIPEPKVDTVKNVLQSLQTNTNSDEEPDNDSDMTTEIENLPLTQPETIPTIATVTTHQNTVPVIEDVITSPENDSPTDVPVRSPAKECSSSEELLSDVPLVERLKKRMQEACKVVTLDDDESDDVMIVESSMEPDTQVKSIMETQDASTLIQVPESQETTDSSPLFSRKPAKLSAEEALAAIDPEERLRLRRLLLQETESQELLETLDSRNENYLHSRSTSDLLGEIRQRSCTASILQLIESDPELRLEAENNVELSQLLLRRPVEQVVVALAALAEKDGAVAASAWQSYVSSLNESQLAELLRGAEAKICNAMPDPILADLFAIRDVALSSEQAAAVYKRIKALVADQDSTNELLDKLAAKEAEGVRKELAARPELRRALLESLSQEEILSQLSLDSEERQSELGARMSDDDLLAMAASKLDQRTEPIDDSSRLLSCLERLAAKLPSASVVQLLEDSDKSTKMAAVSALANRGDLLSPLKKLPEVQQEGLVFALCDSFKDKKEITRRLQGQLRDGALLETIGCDRLVQLMTLGVMNADIKAREAIPKIFCNSDTVEAACQVLRDGANDAQINMFKECLPKPTLAAWVTELILK